MTVTVKRKDRWVANTSKIPANEGQKVYLHVRELLRDPPVPNNAPVVLMLHGRSVSGVASFDLGGDDASGYWSRYSWAESLARKGLRVFVMDLQGSGRSYRPEMDDPCNAWKADQTKLIPKPLSAPCNDPYPYPKKLNTSVSDGSELATVVQYIQDLYHIRKVSLVGWSAAAFALGPYAMANQESVDSLFLFAPIFPPHGLTTAPGPMPRYGFPMTIQTRAEFEKQWDDEVARGALREDGITDVVWDANLKNDELGRLWGQGVMRNRVPVWWGWNEDTVKGSALGSRVPVAIVYGSCDIQTITLPDLDTGWWTDSRYPEQAGPPFHVKSLYRAIRHHDGASVLMIRVNNTGHFMPWETQYEVLHDYSADWIKDKSIDGQSKDSFERGPDGRLVPLPAGP